MADLPTYRRQNIAQQIGVVRASPAAGASLAQLGKLADDFGAYALKDYAQQVQADAERDGIAQGVARDENGELTFTPRQDNTVYARAFNRAGMESYRAAFAIDVQNAAKTLALEYKDDPEGFQSAWEAKRDGALSAMHPDLRPYAVLKFNELGTQTATALYAARHDRVMEQTKNNLAAEAKLLADKYEGIFAGGGAMDAGGKPSKILAATKDEFEHNLRSQIELGFMTQAQADAMRRDLYVVRAKKALYGHAFEREFQAASASGGYEQAIVRTGQLVDRVLADDDLTTDEKFSIAHMLRQQLNLRTEADLRAQTVRVQKLHEAATARAQQLTVAAEDARLRGDGDALRRIVNEAYEDARTANPQVWSGLFNVYRQIRNIADAEEKARIDAKLQSITAALQTPTRPEATGDTPAEQVLARPGLTAAEIQEAAVSAEGASASAQSAFHSALQKVMAEIAEVGKRAADAELAIDVLRHPQGFITNKDQANFIYRAMVGLKGSDPVDVGDLGVRGVRSALASYDFTQPEVVGDFITRRLAHIPDDYDAMMTGKAASQDAQSLFEGLKNYRSLGAVHRAKLSSAAFWEALNSQAQDAGEESIIRIAHEIRRQQANPTETEVVERRWGAAVDAFIAEHGRNIVFKHNAGLFTGVLPAGTWPSDIERMGSVEMTSGFEAAWRRETLRELARNPSLSPDAAANLAYGALSKEWRPTRWERADRKWTMGFQPPEEPTSGGDEAVRESVYRFIVGGLDTNTLHIPGETRESFDLKRAISEDRFVIRKNRDRAGYSIILFDEMGRGIPVTDLSGEGRVWDPADKDFGYAATLPYHQRLEAAKEANSGRTDPLSVGLDQLGAFIRYHMKRAGTGGLFGVKPPHHPPSLLERGINAISETIELQKAKP